MNGPKARLLSADCSHRIHPLTTGSNVAPKTRDLLTYDGFLVTAKGTDAVQSVGNLKLREAPSGTEILG